MNASNFSRKSQFNVNWIDDEEGKNVINSDSDAVLKGGEHGEDKNQAYCYVLISML